MKKLLRGVVRGKTIQLLDETGVSDGRLVLVTIETLDRDPDLSDEERLAALKRAAGGWSDDPEGLDRYLEENRRQRTAWRREIAE